MHGGGDGDRVGGADDKETSWKADGVGVGLGDGDASEDGEVSRQPNNALLPRQIVQTECDAHHPLHAKYLTYGQICGRRRDPRPMSGWK